MIHPNRNQYKLIGMKHGEFSINVEEWNMTLVLMLWKCYL